MRFYANVLLSRLVNETLDWFREKTRNGSIVPVNSLRISLQKHQRSLQSRCKRYTNITQLAHNTPSIGRTFKNIVFASFHRNGYLLFSIDLLFLVLHFLQNRLHFLVKYNISKGCLNRSGWFR